jgi:hypothetical protein
MRCLACNKILSDYEATRRFEQSKEFVDLCNHCFYSGVSEELNTSEREDLSEIEDDNEPVS